MDRGQQKRLAALMIERSYFQGRGIAPISPVDRRAGHGHAADRLRFPERCLAPTAESTSPVTSSCA